MQQTAPKMEMAHIPIRYEGRDADFHEIDLFQLGQSLQGMARILAVTAHFAQTGKINKNIETLDVQVIALPVKEHHCYEVLAKIKNTSENLGLWSGLGTVAITGIIGYIFNRHKDAEMKYLSDALNKVLDIQNKQNFETQTRLLSLIEKLANALQPAARQALAPIGKSVESIGIYTAENQAPAVVLDGHTRAAFDANSEKIQITPMRTIRGIISEMDMMTGNCKIALEDDLSNRIAAVIHDPIVQQPNNPYALAMAELTPRNFSAKMQINEEGQPVKIYISDILPEG